VSPKALYNRQLDEYRFYQKYVRRAAFCDDLKSILSYAGKESAKSGVGLAFAWGVAGWAWAVAAYLTG
jgi:hypothetical protein